jgi:hypothetical protein
MTRYVCIYICVLFYHCITHHNTFRRVMTYGTHIIVIHIDVHVVFIRWDSTPTTEFYLVSLSFASQTEFRLVSLSPRTPRVSTHLRSPDPFLPC